MPCKNSFYKTLRGIKLLEKRNEVVEFFVCFCCSPEKDKFDDYKANTRVLFRLQTVQIVRAGLLKS